MFESLWSVALLAQKGSAAPQQPGFMMFLPLLAVGLVFYLLLLRPQRKEQQQRQSMIEAVKKNDRIVTVGGIYGVVTNVRREADEVTIKVDEASNTKLRITLSSIARVVSESDADDKSTS
jgi:preprotein translocase subunit YajC